MQGFLCQNCRIMKTLMKESKVDLSKWNGIPFYGFFKKHIWEVFRPYFFEYFVPALSPRGAPFARVGAANDVPRVFEAPFVFLFCFLSVLVLP